MLEGREEGWAQKGGDWVWRQREGGGQEPSTPPPLWLGRLGGP